MESNQDNTVDPVKSPKPRKELRAIPTAVLSAALSLGASAAANEMNGHSPRDVADTVAAVASQDPTQHVEVGLDHGGLPVPELRANQDGHDEPKPAATTHTEQATVSVNPIRPYAFEYSGDAAAHEEPSGEPIRVTVDRAKQQGYSVDRVTIRGTASDEGNTYGPDGQILPDAGLAQENPENIDLADTRARTAAPVVSHEVNTASGRDVPLQFTRGQEIVDPTQAERLNALAAENGMSPLDLIAAANPEHNSGVPQLSPEVQAAVDNELDPDRRVDVTLDLSKQVPDGSTVTHHPGKHSGVDIVPIIVPIFGRRRSGAAAALAYEAQTPNYPDVKPLKDQNPASVAEHRKQPRNQNMHKETQRRGGKMPRSHGGSRS